MDRCHDGLRGFCLRSYDIDGFNPIFYCVVSDDVGGVPLSDADLKAFPVHM